MDDETGTVAAATDDPAVPVNNDACSDSTADTDTGIENNSSLSRFFCKFCDIRSLSSGDKGFELKRKGQYGTFKKVKQFMIEVFNIDHFLVKFKFQNYNSWKNEWIVSRTNFDILGK